MNRPRPGIFLDALVIGGVACGPGTDMTDTGRRHGRGPRVGRRRRRDGRALRDQASLAVLRNDPTAARDLLRRALAVLEPVYGSDHPTLARLLSDLGVIFGEFGELKEGEDALVRVLAIDT